MRKFQARGYATHVFLTFSSKNFRSWKKDRDGDKRGEKRKSPNFKEISAAYEVLSDDKKRALYYQYGEAGVNSTIGGQAGAYTMNSFDLFETFFGPSMGFPGMDATGFGTRQRSTVAKACAGTGAKTGSRMRICSMCSGRVQVIRTEQTPFGMFSQVSICPNCGGDGEMISEYCQGRLRVKKDIKVKNPPAVSRGSILRVAGEGDAGPKGGPPGDLYVYLDIEEIPGIQRDGINHLYVYLDIEEMPRIQRGGINLSSSVSISYLDAVLGTVVKVKTVEGLTDLQIPPGTQPGDVLVLARKGAPKLNRPSIRGDYLFTAKISIPKQISSKGRELLEDLASLSSTPSKRSKTHPKVQQTTKTAQSQIDSAAEKSEESEDQNNVWKKLTDFAGSVANGELK